MTRRLFPEYHQKQQEEHQHHCVNANQDGADRAPSPFQQMRDVTLEYLAHMEANSTFFDGSTDANTNHYIAQLEPREIELGGTLGMGEFGVLTKVTRIRLMPPSQKRDNPLLESHRFAASSVNLQATASETETTGDSLQTMNGYDYNRSTVGTTPQVPSEMSRSITLAKLEHPVPPIEYRAAIQQKSADLLIRSAAICVEAEQAQQLRQELEEQVSRNNNDGKNASVHSHKRKLALKQARKDLYPKKKLEATKDLAREAKFLSRLHHPNIICLRGVVSQPGRLEFGLLLDRLGMTLSEEVSQWHLRQEEIIASHRTPVVTPVLEAFSTLFQHQQQHRSSAGDDTVSIPELNSKHQQHYTRQALWLLGERVLALWDVAQGMQYLHTHKILFRDLKTENVASLLVDDNVLENTQQQPQRMQIFDFGLAKECKAVDRVAATQEEGHPSMQTNSFVDFYAKYHMTGLTGTLRIMAPEVIQCLPYGLPADVYSFGACLWEVFSGTKDNCLTAAEICKGARPTIPGIDRNSGAGMPLLLQSLLKKCWAHDPLQRPTFDEIGLILHTQLVEIQQRQQGLPTSRHGSQSNTRNNSRSSSPLGRNHRGLSDGQNMEHLHKAAAQAVFWRRLETIHSSSNIVEDSSRNSL
ncbi:protein tyrosine kinase [Nitzschia inconspicua]|uniref:Protein tyrosine kinase n=1 Tax=Nitzschia inconspicua TaxID=303405 RepID=A0A9K3LXC7_9STRA|nr:protein tyrosine kinase [Nitzschia inconspicua]